MYRYFVSLVSLILLLAAPLSAQQETMRVNSDRVNLRKAPSVDSAVVRALAKGTLVTVMAHDGNWVKVQMQGQTAMGWIRSDLLVAAPLAMTSSTTATPPPPPPPAPPAAPPSSRTTAPATKAPPAATPPPTRPMTTKPAPMAHAMSSDNSYRGGLTLFGGITMFKPALTPAPNASEGLANASGFTGGLGAIMHMGGPIGLELDVAYVQKGIANNFGGIKYTEHDNYAQGSLLLRPAFGSGAVRVFLLGGANVGLAIDCKFSPADATACKIDGKTTSRIDYGATLGGGISFGPLAVQARYEIGVANLSKVSGETAKNKGFMIMAGLVL